MVNYEESYAINDVLRAIALREKYIEEAERTGNLDFITILLDTKDILKKANLTDMEYSLIQLRYHEGLTYKEIGRIYDWSHMTSSNYLDIAIKKIEKVLRSWEKCF